MSRRGGPDESLAADFLERQGLKILERNYRCRFGEIDLVAASDAVLVFVEVRARRSDELYFEGIEQDFLRNALAINNNNRTRAAPQLGIGHSGLMRTLKRIANRIGALIIQHWFIFAPK